MDEKGLSQIIAKFLDDINLPTVQMDKYKTDVFSFLFEKLSESKITEKQKNEIYATLFLSGIAETSAYLKNAVLNNEGKAQLFSEFLSIVNSFLFSIKDFNPFPIKLYIEHYINGIFPSYTKYYLNVYLKKNLDVHHQYN